MTKLKTFFQTYAGISPAVLMIGFFMLIPITIIVLYSLLEANPYGGVRWIFSLDAYTRLIYESDLDGNTLFNPTYFKITMRSIWIAVCAVIASILVGFPIAYYIAIQKPAKQNILIFLITIPFWTNLLIRTYCWILILRDTGIVNSVAQSSGIVDTPMTLLYTDSAIVLGLIYTYVPFMILPIYATIEKLDKRLIEAARDLYAYKWQTFRYVILPLAMPGIVAGSILVFIPSLGAFIAPDLLGGGKNLMLGSLIQLQFSSSRNWPFGSALAVITLAIIMIALLYYVRNTNKKPAGGFF